MQLYTISALIGRSLSSGSSTQNSLSFLGYVHLYTLFMMVPIFNSMARIDRSLLEAASDGGASGWQTLWYVIIPLCKPGIAIGSIFVLAIVMGDFVTVNVLGGGTDRLGRQGDCHRAVLFTISAGSRQCHGSLDRSSF